MDRIIDTLITEPGKYRVSAHDRCTICGGTKWCLHGHGVTICPRSADGCVTYRDGRPRQVGEFGFVHAETWLQTAPDGPAWLAGSRAVNIYIGGNGSTPPRQTPHTAPVAPVVHSRPGAPPMVQTGPDTRPADVLHLVYRIGQLSTGNDGERWAQMIDVPASAVAMLEPGIGNPYEYPTGRAGTIPERDGDGRIVGLHLRWPDGRKLSYAHRGLTYRHDTDMAAVGRVVIVEGASDVAAGLALFGPDTLVVGRPSNTGGIDHLVDLLARIPTDAEIIVIGENDGGPGIEGAEETARRLTERTGRRVSWCLPPDEAKDLRAWAHGQALGRTTPLEQWRAAGRRFFDAIYPDNEGVCPNYPKRENTSRDNSDNEPDAQAFCPHPRRIAGVKPDGTPLVIAKPCGHRTCPTCGPRWRDQWRHQVAEHLATHGGPVYSTIIDDADLDAAKKAAQRAAKAEGAQWGCFTIACATDRWLLITTAPAAPDAEPADLAALADVVDDATEYARWATPARPIRNSRNWGRLPEPEKDSTQFTVISGDPPSQMAFSTVAGWIGTKARMQYWKEGRIECLVAPQALAAAKDVQEAAALFFACCREYDWAGEDAARAFFQAVLMPELSDEAKVNRLADQILRAFA